MNHSTLPAVLEETLAVVQDELRSLTVTLSARPELDLGTAETLTLARLREIGATVLTGALAARGTGKGGSRLTCGCGGALRFEGYRAKAVQTVVGWITLRRADYRCAACGAGHVPLDTVLRLARDSHSPGVRHLACHLGTLLPFAQAAATPEVTAGVRLSASTARTVTETIGAQQEAAVQQATAQAWAQGLPPVAGLAPDRLSGAMDGVRMLRPDGAGREVKVGVVRPEQTGDGDQRTPAATSYAAGLEPAEAFGRRLALEAHRRGLAGAKEVVVLGDGAAWIWNLAAEHFPDAIQIVDWYHASERLWALGRARYGEGTAQARRWVERQLARLAKGQGCRLVAAWRQLRCQGTVAQVRDEQVTYFTNQANRMAYDRYRAQGLDIGSGLVEGACKHLIGAREKGPGMRWSEPGAQAVAHLRVALYSDRWDELGAA